MRPELERSGRGVTVAATLLSLILVIQIGVAIYVLVKAWPVALEIAKSTAPANTQGRKVWVLRLFRGVWLAPSEDVYLLLVLGGGALGSGIASLTSLSVYIGNRRLVARWIPYYLFRLPIGVALPLVVYAAIRGGLLNVSAVGSDLNPYGIVTISGLTGMFAGQIVERLRKWVEKGLEEVHLPGEKAAPKP